jgi:hypothetical protein
MFQATLDNGTSAGNFNSKEFALGISHARKLSPALSLGMNLKYINSNLLGNYQGSGGLAPRMTVNFQLSRRRFINRPEYSQFICVFRLGSSN